MRQSLEAEIAVAAAIAARVGLAGAEPELLHLGNHTTLLLRPWPIVARIASGPSFDLCTGTGFELSVAAHLADRNAPCVRPARTVAPGPFAEKNCVVTLWEFVDGRPVASPSDQRLAAAALKAFHHGLADFTGDLPSFIRKVESCEAILADPCLAPQLADDDRQFLLQVDRRFRRRLAEQEFAVQPLHGDAHPANAMIMARGAIWMDLESVCTGPLEWDVAFLPADTWVEFGDIDTELAAFLADVHSLCVATWCWAEFGRSAATDEAAVDRLGYLKERFGPMDR